MAITTPTSREFNQNTSRAKRAAEGGPVFIVDRGRPAHVLVTIKEHRRLTGSPARIADLPHWPGAEAVDRPDARVREPARAADLG